MGKKALRRRVAQLEHDLGLAERGQEKEAALREDLHARLFDAGLLLIGDGRTRADRLRAARAGVLVLADVEIVGGTETRLEQDAFTGYGLGGFVRQAPGPIRAFAKLEITGDPAVIEALAEHLRTR